jgi:hypothetical protein
MPRKSPWPLFALGRCFFSPLGQCRVQAVIIHIIRLLLSSSLAIRMTSPEIAICIPPGAALGRRFEISGF